MMVLFGLTFLFPVLLVALELAGVVTPAKLLSWWRWAVIGITAGGGDLHPELGPVLDAGPGRAARRLLLPRPS